MTSIGTSGERAGAGVVVISAAHFLIGVDGLAVAIALAAVQRDLGVAAIDGQWVLSAYGLAFGGTLLLSGRLGDLYGRRRVLVSGLGAFATGALAAALGYSPLQAGLALLPLDVIAFVVSLAGARAIARRTPRALLFPSFTLTAVALLWLARAPVPADYLSDVLGPLIVLGASLPVAFVVLTQEAVAAVDPDERGLASGIFETANHLFGGAVGVALYATLLTAGGYRSAFLAGASLALAGLLAAHMSRAHDNAAC